MTLLKPESDFQQLVLEAYQSLPPQQQLVATFMLDHLREVPFLSVPDLAIRSGASEATIVRFAQRIGYDGYASLKAALLQAVREKVVPSSATVEALSRVPEGEDVVTEVATLEMDNINTSIENLDRDLVDAVADALFEATLIHTFGMGISAYLSELFAYLLTQIGLRAQALPRGYSSPLEPLINLQPTEAVVVFSLPPYSLPTLEVAKVARSRRTTTIAVCDRATAPVASIANHAIPVRTTNMMYTNSFAALSVLLNALTTTIAMRHPEFAADAVTRITNIFDEDSHLIEPTGASSSPRM